MLFQLLQTTGIVLPLLRASGFPDPVKEKSQLLHLYKIHIAMLWEEA